jgi:DNA-binding response OmpR family regulator
MTLKVLTVDDSKTIRMIVRKAFKPYDCDIYEGENGVEGLAAAAREKPDLIVLDIGMPVMSGIEMLDKLNAEPGLKDIPVIMLTAESAQDTVMQIAKMGVKDYVVKPFRGQDLIERVEKIIRLEPKRIFLAT